MVPYAGFTIPNYNTGDILYLTGTAEIFHGESAQKIMPRINRLLQIKTTGAILIHKALPYTFEFIEPSPYNPPIRLASEKRGETSENSGIRATLTKITRHAPDISSFTFSISKPCKQIPGQYAILSFAELIDYGYQHMSAKPSSVNDDRIRTWTISSSPKVKDGKFLPINEFVITVKHKLNGVMSTLLHVWNQMDKLEIPLLGIEGEFTCFNKNGQLQDCSRPKMFMISGGIGITPFLSVIKGLISTNQNVDILLWAVATTLEGSMVDQLKLFAEETKIKIRVKLFITREKVTEVKSSVHNERIGVGHFKEVGDIMDRDIYLCGPDGFMVGVKKCLDEIGYDAKKIRSELFTY